MSGPYHCPHLIQFNLPSQERLEQLQNYIDNSKNVIFIDGVSFTKHELIGIYHTHQNQDQFFGEDPVEPDSVLFNYRLLLQHKLFYSWQHQALSDFIHHPTLFDSFKHTYKHAEEERSSLVYWRSEQHKFATANMLYQAFTAHLATCQAPPSIEAGHSTAPLTTSHSEETSGLHSMSLDIETPMSSAPLAELPLYHSTLYLKLLKVLPPATSHIPSGHSSESDDTTSSFTVITRDQQVPFFKLRRGYPELIPSTQYPNTYIAFDLAVNFIFIPNVDPDETYEHEPIYLYDSYDPEYPIQTAGSPTNSESKPEPPATTNPSAEPSKPTKFAKSSQFSQYSPNSPNPLPMTQPQTAKPPKINPFKGDPCCFQTFQDELRLIFDGYSTTFQDNQGNTDDRKKIIYALQNMTDGNAAGF
ncbi:hypothetical protein P691DRAFT_762885 [Macrolepiota fuliginosa MF-IS2]|uniref:Uncharacterized protein n=1 Tax=Macrolepiota fuliginosa MF-IS2 TaxID=1400762 RepID=A0A9P6BYC4_9AGAR|nr:hypothetical protein P691DRAFT_762885 [Macrolepiota fuliginosa MF-IS2]